MKKLSLILLLLAFSFAGAQDLVLIRFADKPSAQTYFSNPELMLTQKALDRRAKYNIELDMMDVPVEQSYIDQVEAIGIVSVAVSKWFNGIFAWCTEAQVATVESLSFVAEVESLVRDSGKIKNHQNASESPVENYNKNIGGTAKTYNFDYGYTQDQVYQIRLDYIHDLGFTGEGVSIAILDNGFPGVDNTDGFEYIRNNGQIKGGYDFVNKNTDIYGGGGTHGTMVLSTIGGYFENEFVGTAIDADFYLYITENNQHELPDEEATWIAAAEEADRVGVDVINSSLGYSVYDDPKYNYTYNDMDGETAYISRGAQIAAEKGIMVVISAGNEGNKDWHYITAPADAKDVFTIGAVDSGGNPAGFSSYGPSADGRIKPDVDAMGVYATIISPFGDITYASGTSFSSPIMAGAMACLSGAFPDEQPSELRRRVRESASRYNNPTNQMGYGIPDFSDAYDKCLGTEEFDLNLVNIYPNPTVNLLKIESKIPVSQIQLISFEGKIIRKYKADTELQLSDLPAGVYILKVQLANGKTEVKKLIKK